MYDLTITKFHVMRSKCARLERVLHGVTARASLELDSPGL